MKEIPFVIKPYGDDALLLEWSEKVDADVLMDILSFKEYLIQKHLKDPHWELIPVYHSLTLINRMDEVNLSDLSQKLPQWYALRKEKKIPKTHYWEIPVCYDKEFAPDLEEVSEKLGMSPQQLIEAHTAHSYRVYGIGFLPGFLYLGDVPDSMKVPRRAEPRLHVTGGSVGLAGSQTGIYPQDSPGGWNIIGSCPIPLFVTDKNPPCMMSPGDQIRFRAVNRAEYDLHQIEAEVGIYNFKKRQRSADN